MTAEKAKQEVAPPEAAKRRYTPKLLVVAGASAGLLLVGVAGAALWLWPKAPDAAEAKAARLAARRVAVPASAPAALPAPTPVAVAASAAEAAEPQPSPAVVAEASLERLQRRLGEVLGPKGAIEAGRSGELRLLTRSSSVAPVRDVGNKAAAEPTSTQDGRPTQAATPRTGPWSYSGLGGPQAWGRLKPEFSQCAAGRRQSPIDIRDGIALDLEPVQFDYQPSGFSVIDNGHTVQVNLAPGNSIEVNGKRYALQQFHFHRPSEERINGRQFEMDAHLVHKDAEGRLAVVAVLLERGAAQPLLQTVWNNLPLEKNEEFAARAPIDLNQLLPTDRRYYTYMGSLTTPPCSEGVLWLVMQQPVPMSAQQIDIFSRLYPMNARPIQQAAGRMIKQSN